MNNLNLGSDLRRHLFNLMSSKYAKRIERGILVHELSQCKKRSEFDVLKEQVAELRRWHPRLMIGELIHQGVFQILTKLYRGEVRVLIEQEFTKRVDEYRVVGHPDVVLCEANTVIKVVDIKYSTKKVEKVEKFQACQVALYKWLTNAKHASILFISPIDIVEVPIELSLDPESHIKYWETNFPLWGPGECEWCEYKHVCPFSKKGPIYVEPLNSLSKNI